MLIGRASLPGCSTVVLGWRSGGCWVVRLRGRVGVADRSNRVVQAVSQGQARGRCRVTRRAEDATRAGTAMSLRRIVAVVALARSGAARVAAAGAGGAGEVERDDREHQPGGVGAGTPRRGRCASAGVLQVGVDLLDDRVMAVGLVRGDGVEDRGSAVVKNAWKRQVSNSVSCPVRAVCLGVEVGNPAHDQPAGHLLGLRLGLERGEGDSATSAREIQLPAAWSKTASVYSMGVQASSAMVAMACLTAGFMGTVTETRAPPLSAA